MVMFQRIFCFTLQVSELFRKKLPSKLQGTENERLIFGSYFLVHHLNIDSSYYDNSDGLGLGGLLICLKNYIVKLPLMSSLFVSPTLFR